MKIKFLILFLVISTFFIFFNLKNVESIAESQNDVDVYDNCEFKGGTIESKKDSNGKDIKVCKFLNNNECEVNAFVTDACKKQEIERKIGLLTVEVNDSLKRFWTNSYIQYWQCPLVTTNNKFDIALDGLGYFEVTDPETGALNYVRGGSIKLDEYGYFMLNGYLLNPQIIIPKNYSFLNITKDGVVLITNNKTNEVKIVGQLNIAIFENPLKLQYLGNNFYRPTIYSGAGVLTTPKQLNYGSIVTGALEINCQKTQNVK